MCSVECDNDAAQINDLRCDMLVESSHADSTLAFYVVWYRVVVLFRLGSRTLVWKGEWYELSCVVWPAQCTRAHIVMWTKIFQCIIADG